MSAPYNQLLSANDVCAQSLSSSINSECFRDVFRKLNELSFRKLIFQATLTPLLSIICVMIPKDSIFGRFSSSEYEFNSAFSIFFR